MDESLSTKNIINSDSFSKFTFNDLSKLNITSEELYLWSIPIDTIGRYQDYLEKLSISSGDTIVYNCSWPRFGSQCQYDLPYYYYSNLSLSEMISRFTKVYRYTPLTYTCYNHIKCDRGPISNMFRLE